MTMNPDNSSRMPSIPPRPQLPNLAAARLRGPAEAVAIRWQQLLLVWRWHCERHQAIYPSRAYPDLAALIEAAGAEPKLRQLYPFTSHFRLCFSSHTSHPWSVRAPSIEPLRDDRFRVLRRSEVIEVTDTAAAAVALAVANLPAGLGPAVDHVEEGARDQ
jgi:hypothetical protein